MSVRTRYRIKIGFFGFALGLSLLIWRGIQAGGGTEEIPIGSYGGDLPPETRAALEGLNRDLHDARDLLSIGVRGVLFEDRSGKIREYRYSGSMLCLDGRPLVSGVNALHFEYRDQWGNLLTHRTENRDFVQTIAYTVRLEDRPSEIFVNSRTTVPHNRTHSDGSDQTRMAFVHTR